MSQTIQITMGEGVTGAPYDDWNVNRLEWLRAFEHLSPAQLAIVLDAVADRVERLAIPMRHSTRMQRLDLLGAADRVKEAALDIRCAISQSLPK